MAVARDKFWLFGVRPHQDDMWLGHADSPGARRKYNWSRITPAEGAFMLDIPNLIMVVCDGEPAIFSHDAYGYAESFCRLERVQWSCSGSGGYRSGNEEKFLCKLAENYPNICGAYMDDFFVDPYILEGKTQKEQDERAKERLSQIAAALKNAPRPLDLHLVYYSQYNSMDVSVFEQVNMLSMWTWHSEELVNLEENFLQMEARFPDKQKLLGIYMYDFEARHPVPVELMAHQCEFGLRMLREGRIAGMIFEANSVMGLRMESELWLRDWLEKNKNTPVPD